MTTTDLTLEKERVVDRLTELEKSTALLTQESREQGKRYELLHHDVIELLKKHDGTLYGNGQKGIVTKVSDHFSNLMWLNRIAWGLVAIMGTFGMKNLLEHAFPVLQ